MLHPNRSAAVLSLALLVAPCTLAAQESVPEELVRALMAPVASGRVPNIALGRLPRGFPAELVPADARVIGGVWRDSTSLVAALAVPQQPAAAGEALQQALVGAGWTGPEARQARGFVGNASPVPWRFLCRGNEQVSIYSAPAPAPGGGSYLRVDYSRQEGPTQCSLMRNGTRGRNVWDEFPLPTLAMPAGAQLVSAGFSGGTMMAGVDGGSAFARLRSSLGAAELAGRFVDQLRQAGWTAGEPSGGAGAAVQTFRRQTPDGKRWLGVLIAVAVPDTDLRDVRFEVQELAAQAP